MGSRFRRLPTTDVELKLTLLCSLTLTEPAILYLNTPIHKVCVATPQDPFQLQPKVLGGPENEQKAHFKVTFNFTLALL